MAVTCCCARAVEEREEVVRPLKDFGSPVLDLCEPKPYVAHQATFDRAFPRGWWYYFRACDVAELADDVIDIMVEHVSRIVSLITSVALCSWAAQSLACASPRPPSTTAMPRSPSTSTATA